MNWKIPTVLPLLLTMCLATSMWSQAQADDPEERVVNSNSQSRAQYDLFTPVNDPLIRSAYAAVAENHRVFELNKNVVDDLERAQPYAIEMPIPGSKVRMLKLEKVDILADGFVMRTATGKVYNSMRALTYQGTVDGKSRSIASLIIYDGKVRILFSDRSGDYRVQKAVDHRYLFFRENDRHIQKPFICETDVSQFKVSKQIEPDHKGRSASAGTCVNVYIECDYESYQDNGSSEQNVFNWVAALFNEVAIIYANDGIDIAISEIFVWDTNAGEPYQNQSSSSGYLGAFMARMDNIGFTGDLAHLISSRSQRSGIAYVDQLCGNLPYSFSGGIATPASAIEAYPQYSWSVMVFTHEMGHTLASPHTHDCSWNGNNTQIDDCGNVSDPTPPGCYSSNNQIIPSSGTIMSYCHQIGGVGINLSNGFGPQPLALIMNRIDNASCSLGSCEPPECTSITAPANNASNVSINTVATWVTLPDADGYLISAGTSAGAADIVSQTEVGQINSFQLSGLPFATEVWLTVIPKNIQGNATGCQSIKFTTESFVLPGCTSLSSPSAGSSGVPIGTTLSWPASSGTAQGYLIDVGTSAGGAQLYDGLDVGSATSWAPPVSLPANTNIYVKVQPYGNGTTITNCTEVMFTTGAANGGNNCAAATNINCGTTVDGSTVGASYDNAAFCGTSNTSRGVWYKFVGDGSYITLSTCGQANFDTKLTIYSGSCGSLNCVAGRDDFTGCSGFTQAIGFQSTAGLEYYILVHGYSNASGTFSLSMSCAANDYCTLSSINSQGAWVSDFTLGSYTNGSGPSLYSDFSDQPVAVASGNAYVLQLTPSFAGSPSGVYFGVWIDFNKDVDFAESEEIAIVGPVTTTTNIPIVLPANLPDSVTMRVAMSQGAVPEACNFFYFGEVEDYLLKLEEECQMVMNANSDGPGSLKSALACAEDGDTITFHQAIAGDTIVLNAMLEVSKDITVLADLSDGIVIDGGSIDRVASITASAEVVVQGLTFMSGTALQGSGISNMGVLKLRDVVVQPGSNSNSVTLFNTGAVSFEGNCDIRD